MERSRDWIFQAQGDLAHARHDTSAEFYDWACFSAQQAAEKAVKALLSRLGAEPWGRSVTELLENLPQDIPATAELLDGARDLDTVYITSRYPDALPSGARGIPYLLGNERLKGSHSMSGYHSFELCYLAAIYTNLLITGQPMDFYFKPQAGALKDNILRVAPDLLPKGSVRLEAVWINGQRYADFDADELTIKLPVHQTQSHPLENRPVWMGNPRLLPKTSEQELRVKVRVYPAGVHADMELTVVHGSAVLYFDGTLHHDDLIAFEMHLNDMVAAHPRRAVFNMQALKGISTECTRALTTTFRCGKLIWPPGERLAAGRGSSRRGTR